MKPMAESNGESARPLSRFAAISLVVGTVIGAGVFSKIVPMTQSVCSPALVLMAWGMAGLLSFAGALSYAELTTMFPGVGGEYIYLRKAYGENSSFGDISAFLYGWMQMAIGQTGSIAALSIVCALFLWPGPPWVERTFHLFGHDLGWQFGLRQVIAIGLIFIFSSINCIGIKFAGHVHQALTWAKVLGIGVIIAGVFLFSKEATWAHLATPPDTAQWSGLEAFGAAMISALWAYEGWNRLPMVAGEVHEPRKNLKLALIIGMVAILVIYLLINLAYFYTLPVNEVVTSYSDNNQSAELVATKAAESFLGNSWAKLASVIFIISTMGALNGVILASAHIPSAMARDGLFFARVGASRKDAGTPVWAICLQAVWASVLALSGTFDQLTDLVVFAYWIFYGLTTASIFALRRNRPDYDRPYKTPGYPVVPLIFVLVAAWLVINSLLTNPLGSAFGLILIALGLPLYFYFRRKHPGAPTSNRG
jgi:basic amino acid/polyamine antiporter, APA family